MPSIIRFGISLDKQLLDKFDNHIKSRKYTNRSEAIRDLIREELVRKNWQEGGEIAGTISLIYDHHKRQLQNHLTDIQHDFQKLIISTQHIHLDQHNCLEIVAVKGSPQEAIRLADALKSTKGVRHATLSMSTTGHGIG